MTESDRPRRPRRTERETRRAAAKRDAGWRRYVDRFGGLPLLTSLAVVVVVVIVLVVLNRPASDSSDQPYQLIQHGETHGLIEGKSDAPVRVVIFADFQCPHCGNFFRVTEPALQSEFVDTGIASFEFHNYAFLGDESVRAAEAAECAAQQGFFWEYHDILFQKQPADGRENVGTFTVDRLKQYAVEMRDAWAKQDPSRQFDTSAFNSCVDSRATADTVQQQVSEANGLGVQSTPSFLINGKLVVGDQPIDALRSAIQQARGGTG
jgi:protein-disulfide isomerase